MKILVTAGSTQVMIDKVRTITNIFKGKTGLSIAQEFDKGNEQAWIVSIVRNETVLLTSNSEGIDSRPYRTYDQYLVHRDKIRNQRCAFHGNLPSCTPACGSKRLGFAVIQYKTFVELAEIMEREIRTGGYDVVIHSAAVSDYEVAGVFVRGEDERLAEVDSRAKISSKHGELFLRMVPTFKIVDKIRGEWGFKGQLVKFKLEVDKSDEELIEIAKKSRAVSDADLIVANCLEWARERAFIIDREGKVESVSREQLPEALARRMK